MLKAGYCDTVCRLRFFKYFINHNDIDDLCCPKFLRSFFCKTVPNAQADG